MANATEAIVISMKTRNRLDKLKEHHRETYDDAIVRLLDLEEGKK